MHFDRHRDKALSDDQLLPLVDIILMLLIFFIMAGKLTGSDPIPINPPASISKAQLGEKALVVVLGQGGELALDGEILGREPFEAALADRLKTSPNARFWLKADAQADTNDVIAVMEILRHAGVERLKLLTAHKPLPQET